MSDIGSFIVTSMQFFAFLLVFILCVLFVAMIVMYFRDIKWMVYEIGVISHLIGVSEPRKWSRKHARIMGAAGTSVELDALYPYQNYHLNHDKMAARLAAATK